MVRATHLGVANVTSIQGIQEVEESQPRNGVPVNLPHELALVHAGRVYFGSVDIIILDDGDDLRICMGLLSGHDLQ